MYHHASKHDAYHPTTNATTHIPIQEAAKRVCIPPNRQCQCLPMPACYLTSRKWATITMPFMHHPKMAPCHCPGTSPHQLLCSWAVLSAHNGLNCTQQPVTRCTTAAACCSLKHTAQCLPAISADHACLKHTHMPLFLCSWIPASNMSCDVSITGHTTKALAPQNTRPEHATLSPALGCITLFV